MIEKLNQILEKLASNLNITFKLEEGGSFAYSINDLLTIQIEMDKHGEAVLIGSNLSEIASGSFKKTVLTNAMKANYLLNEPSFFGFVEKNSNLILFELLEIESLTAEILQEHLMAFIDKALAWQESFKRPEGAPLDFLQLIERTK